VPEDRLTVEPAGTAAAGGARQERIPGELNLVILGGCVLAACALLYAASHTGSLVVMLGAGVAFSFAANTFYSLMHEAVHRHFHPNLLVNETAGRIASGFFPTAFSLQRAFHLAHHRNNRSDLERFDYYAQDENRFIKVVQWYLILTGVYWITPPVFCVVYFFSAELLNWKRLFGAQGEWFARQTSAKAFLDVLSTVPIWLARADILIALAIQLALIATLDLSLWGWAVCYACFAVNWSGLQYTDHAFSELDGREGAWNLRVSPLVRALFLNYHFHLVHHRDPSIPWTRLPDHVRPGDPNPSFWEIYLKMWRGPRPLPGTGSRGKP
jgi:fatty acid desaturase